MPTTLLNHPPDTQRRDLGEHDLRGLRSALPRLRLLERLALRVALRALARLEHDDREAAIRRHELVLENERRRDAIERDLLLRRPFR